MCFHHLQALSSLRRYPLPLSSGQEAKILDHVGKCIHGNHLRSLIVQWHVTMHIIILLFYFEPISDLVKIREVISFPFTVVN